ncbi:MAG TPA: hypothetical protein VGK73_07755 [Polyangiaceae bacterium]
MSVVTCSKCSAYVDSDYDCDCFIGDIVACEHCRERMEQAGELDVETNTLVTAKKKAKVSNYDGNGSDADDQPCPECK